MTDLRTAMLQLLREPAFHANLEQAFFAELEKRVPGSTGAAIDHWNDFFREGLVNFELDRARYHVTAVGTTASAESSRDPSNADAYLAYVDRWLPQDGIARSYIEEALLAFRMRCDRAAALLIGAAMESLTLRLAGTVKRIGGTSKKIVSRNIREVSDGIRHEIAHVIDVRGPTSMAGDLRDRWDATFVSLAHLIRTTRNDVGHPPLLEPIGHDEVRAMFVAFTQLVPLLHDLGEWLDPKTWR